MSAMIDWDLVFCWALVLHPLTVALCIFAFRNSKE